jgi:hypothetical protein
MQYVSQVWGLLERELNLIEQLSFLLVGNPHYHRLVEQTAELKKLIRAEREKFICGGLAERVNDAETEG